MFLGSHLGYIGRYTYCSKYNKRHYFQGDIMKTEEEITQYIRGLEINRKLAFIRDEMDMVKEYDTQINILKWIIGEK